MERIFILICCFAILQIVSAQDNHILLAVTAAEQHVISVVDLQNPESNCDSIYLEPLVHLTDLQSTTASFVNGELLVCGAPSGECYYYNDASDSWRDGPDKNNYRFLPFGIDLNSTYHWLSGGRDTNGNYYDNSEEYDGDSYSIGITLPLNVSDHCVVNLGGDEVMLIGGRLK